MLCGAAGLAPRTEASASCIAGWLRAQANVATKSPYDLRHAFTSLLLAENPNPVEVAEQLGHSPAMTLTVYGQVIAELRGEPKRPALGCYSGCAEARRIGR